MKNSAGQKSDALSGNKMFLLNIDDDADDGFFFMQAVENITPEATCLLISSGETAVELLTRDIPALPDYIFLDINMPGMDGRDCLAKLRSMAKLTSVPIVMFSTSISNREKQSFINLNASTCEKPSDFSSLKSIIAEILTDGAEGRAARNY